MSESPLEEFLSGARKHTSGPGELLLVDFERSTSAGLYVRHPADNRRRFWHLVEAEQIDRVDWHSSVLDPDGRVLALARVTPRGAGLCWPVASVDLRVISCKITEDSLEDELYFARYGRFANNVQIPEKQFPSSNGYWVIHRRDYELGVIGLNVWNGTVDQPVELYFRFYEYDEPDPDDLLGKFIITIRPAPPPDRLDVTVTPQLFAELINPDVDPYPHNVPVIRLVNGARNFDYRLWFNVARLGFCGVEAGTIEAQPTVRTRVLLPAAGPEGSGGNYP
jgi:hypothetical protein